METSRGAHHSIQRLRKSVGYADELMKCCEGVVDAKTQLEIRAYFQYLTGLLKFELQHWIHAESSLTEARTIYNKLGESAVGVKKQAYLDLIQELVPSLRFCAYQTGNKKILNDLIQGVGDSSSNMLVDQKLKKLMEESKDEESSRLDVVDWQISADDSVSVPAEKNLKQVKGAIAGMRQYREEIFKTGDADVKKKIDTCDTALGQCREAIQEVRSDINNQTGKADARQIEQSQLLLAYLQWTRTMWMAERNIYLVEELDKKRENYVNEKPSDYARLFDLVVNQLTDLEVENDKLSPLKNVNNDLTAAFRALRAYYLTIHETKITENFRNALALNRLSISLSQDVNLEKYKTVLSATFLNRIDAAL